jgi:hypothetical protein
MKESFLIMTLSMALVFSASCLSPPSEKNPYRPISKIQNAVVIDAVETDFYSNKIAGFHSDNEQISETAYIELLK